MVAVAGVLTALADADRRPVLDWLTEHLVRSGHLEKTHLDELGRIQCWNFEAPATEPDGGGADGLRDRRQARELVARAYTAAVRVPYAAPLLTLYLKHECDEAWEHSWLHEPIRLTIDAARDAWEASAHLAGPVDVAVTPATLACLAVLDHELLVESAAATGSLRHTARRARRAAEAARTARRLAEEHRPRLGRDVSAGPLLAQVRESGEREECYYDAVAAAALAFDGHFTGGPDDLDAAIGRLRAVEHQGDLIDEIDRSELRAHRAGLETLAAARDRPWLQVDHGEIVYLYPFGLRNSERLSLPEEFVEALRDNGESWSLAGLAVRKIRRELPLNDIWQGHDPHRRQHAGAAAELPDLLVPDPDGGEPVRLTVELRLCDLGNHHLRLSAPLHEATPPALHAAMLRPAPEFGDLTELGLHITAGGTSTPLQWGRLADFSAAVIDDVAAQLGADVEHSGRPGLYHVLVSVQRASRRCHGAGPQPVGSGADLVGLLGAEPVWHPVRHGVSAIGEWVRYPVDPELIVVSPAFAGDLLVRTANSTLMAIFGSPDYMIGAVREAAEFVATLEGLFAAWQQELAAYYTRIQKLLESMLGELGQQGAPPLAGLQDLRQEQLRLHRFVMMSRRTLMFVTAPSLVTSPVMRVTLDRLLDAAGFQKLRNEFEGMVVEVLGDRLGTLVDTTVRRQQERHLIEEEDRDRRQRRRTEIVLALLAGIGSAGVFQLLHAGLQQTMVWAGIFAVLAVLIGVVVAYVVHRTSRPEPDPAEPPGPGP